MARNLRRSRRAGNNPVKKTSAYNVDDIVEISRGNAVVKARLAELLSDPSSKNPLWLVKFDGLPLKDEEVYEHVFSKNHSPNSDNSSSDRENYSRGRHSRNSRGYGSDNDHHHHHHHSSNRSSEESETGGESSRTRAKRALAREARSRRRQAQIDRAAVGKRRLPPPPPPNHPSRQKGKRARSNNHHSNNGNNANGDEDGDVVKVKLLTGTLYMYRGLHRRAEFVRKV